VNGREGGGAQRLVKRIERAMIRLVVSLFRWGNVVRLNGFGVSSSRL